MKKVLTLLASAALAFSSLAFAAQDMDAAATAGHATTSTQMSAQGDGSQMPQQQATMKKHHKKHTCKHHCNCGKKKSKGSKKAAPSKTDNAPMTSTTTTDGTPAAQ